MRFESRTVPTIGSRVRLSLRGDEAHAFNPETGLRPRLHTAPTEAMTITGDPAATEPKYYTVKRHLLEFIGSLDPGAPVPTERELATELETSRTTVRQALGELVVEGRLVRRQGSGTFVSEPKITWPLYLASFTEQVEASGFKPPPRYSARSGSRLRPTWPSSSRSRPARRSTGSSGCASPTPFRSRSRPRGCRPSASRALPARSAPTARCTRSSPTTTRPTCGPARSVSRRRLRTPREAGPLRVDVGTPMLIVSRQNFDSAGTPIELGRTWFRSDRVTLVTHLAIEAAMTAAGVIETPTQLLGGGRVVTPVGVLTDAWVQVTDGHIAQVAPGTPDVDAPVVDLAGAWLLPGYIDLHMHGGGGHSVADSPSRWRKRSLTTAATAPRRRWSR